MDLPERFEFHGPVMPSWGDAYAAWAYMCGKLGITIIGERVFTEYPEGVSVGHRMTSE